MVVMHILVVYVTLVVARAMRLNYISLKPYHELFVASCGSCVAESMPCLTLKLLPFR